MNKWIDADAAVDAVKRSEALVRAFGFHNAIEAIREVPAADVAPVRHGRWESEQRSITGGHGVYIANVCSCCGRSSIDEYPFCPHCGAKMDGGEYGDVEGLAQTFAGQS